MRALVHSAGPLSLVARRLVGPHRLAGGIAAPIRLAQAADPPPPAPGWLTVRPLLAGICGSDLAALTGKSPPVLWPLVSFPSVPGHEVLARVEEVGEGVEGLSPGDRLVVDPFVTCAVRGAVPCAACRSGRTAACARAPTREGGIGPGMMIGFHRDLPGGWGERMRVHQSQAHRVPEGLPDSLAVLVEPLSVAVHALRSVTWRGDERVLILGGGSLGLLTAAAMQGLGLPTPALRARHPHQAEAARALGADPIWQGRDDRLLMAEVGSFSLKGLVGGRLWLGGGLDVVVDAVGTGATLSWCLRLLRPGGTLLRVGDVGILPAPVPAPAWAPDVRVITPFAYGREEGPGGEGRHTFDLVMQSLAAGGWPDLEGLVTHRFPLGAYREALATALDRGRRRAIKVVLHPESR